MTTVITTDFYNRYAFSSDRKELADNHWDCEIFENRPGTDAPRYKVRIWFFADSSDCVVGDRSMGSELVASAERIEVLEGCFIAFLNYEGSLEDITIAYNEALNKAYAA